MKNYFVLMAFLGIYMLAPLNAGSRTSSGVEVEQEQDSAWVGPGWYSGVWFNDEDDYNDWRYRRQGNDNRGEDRGDRGGDRGRGSEGRGGESRGGNEGRGGRY